LSVYALQTAREGSKSVPRKNLLDVEGFPLFRYNLWAARAALSVDHVYLSTDSAEMADGAREDGVTVIKRPAHLATDTCSHWETIKHWIEHMDGLPEIVVVLLGNSYGAKPEEIDCGVHILQSDDTIDSVISVAEFNMFNPCRAYRRERGRLVPMVPRLENTSDLGSNDKRAFGDVYFFNGSYWIIRTSVFFENQGRGAFPWLGNNIVPIVQNPVYQELDAEWQRMLFQ